MNVTHVLHGDDVGGCEILCLTALRAGGDLTRLVVSQTGGQLEGDLSDSADTTTKIPNLSSKKPWRVAQAAMRLKEDGASRSDYVILWHGRRQLLNSLIMLRLAGVDSPILAHVGTTVEAPSRKERLEIRALRGLGLHRSLIFVTPTEAVAESLSVNFPWSQHAVVANAVRRPTLMIASKNAAARLVMISRFDDSKDQAGLVRAFARLRAVYPTLQLLLIGDGPMKSKVECIAVDLQVNDLIEWVGIHTDPWRFVRQTDIFVFATHPREGFGLALAEAIVSGLRVVASDTPAARRFGLDSQVLYKYGDKFDLVERLRNVLGAPLGSVAKPGRTILIEDGLSMMRQYHQIARSMYGSR